MLPGHLGLFLHVQDHSGLAVLALQDFEPGEQPGLKRRAGIADHLSSILVSATIIPA